MKINKASKLYMVKTGVMKQHHKYDLVPVVCISLISQFNTQMSSGKNIPYLDRVIFPVVSIKPAR